MFLPAVLEVSGLPNIKLAGIGGAGVYILKELSRQAFPVEYLCFDSSLANLESASFSRAISLGEKLSKGLGCGANNDLGRQVANASRAEIAASLENTDLLILVAGLGGGLGSGAITVIANIAQQLKIPTICFVTKPFAFEGKKRLRIAADTIAELEQSTNGVLAIDHHKLLGAYPKDTHLVEALNMGAKHLALIIERLLHIIQTNALINIDFSDILAVFKSRGQFAMGVAQGEGGQELKSLVKLAIQHPLTEFSKSYSADGIIVYVEANEEFNLSSLAQASDYVSEISNDKTEIIVGINCTAGNHPITVTILAAGINTIVEKPRLMAVDLGREVYING